MKKHLLTLLLLGTAGMAYAQDYVQVVVGGDEQNYALDQVARIEFASEGVTVVASDETGDTYLFEDNLERILFHPTVQTGVANVKDDRMTLFVARDGNHISIRGWSGVSDRVSIYDINGRRLINIADWAGADIDVSSLATGVYVITVGDKSTKFKK